MNAPHQWTLGDVGWSLVGVAVLIGVAVGEVWEACTGGSVTAGPLLGDKPRRHR